MSHTVTNCAVVVEEIHPTTHYVKVRMVGPAVEFVPEWHRTEWLSPHLSGVAGAQISDTGRIEYRQGRWYYTKN